MIKKSKLSKLLSAVLAFGMIMSMLPTAMAEVTTETQYANAVWSYTKNKGNGASQTSSYEWVNATSKNTVTRYNGRTYIVFDNISAENIRAANFSVYMAKVFNAAKTVNIYYSKQAFPVMTDNSTDNTAWNTWKENVYETQRVSFAKNTGVDDSKIMNIELTTIPEKGDTIVVYIPNNNDADIATGSYKTTDAEAQAARRPHLTYTISDEEPVFELTDKTVTETIVANEAVTATATFTNTTTTAENVCVIAALYEQSGRMIGVDFTETTVAANAGEGVEVSAELTAPQTVPTGAYAKVFVWNSMSGMTPIN